MTHVADAKDPSCSQKSVGIMNLCANMKDENDNDIKNSYGVEFVVFNGKPFRYADAYSHMAFQISGTDAKELNVYFNGAPFKCERRNGIYHVLLHEGRCLVPCVSGHTILSICLTIQVL